MPRNEFEGFSIGQFFRAPVRFVQEWLGDDEGVRANQTVVERIIGFFTWPFRFLYGFAVFMVMAWTTSRNGYAFIRGLPAIGGIGMAVIVWWATGYFEPLVTRQTQSRYLLHSTKDPDKPEYAEWFAEKLVSREPNDLMAKYQLGVARERAGKIEKARVLMELLTPFEDENKNGVLDPGEDANGDDELTLGLPDAHSWLGNFFLSDDYGADLDEETKVAKAIDCYEKALAGAETESMTLFALDRLARIHGKYGNDDESIKYFEQLTQRPMSSLQQLKAIPLLIKFYQDRGEDRKARLRLEAWIRRIEPLTISFSDRFEIWQVMAQCAVMLDNFEQAQRIINEGQQMTSNDEVRSQLEDFSVALSISKADKFEDMNDKEQFQGRLFALGDAVSRNPYNAAIYQRLVEFAVPSENAEEKSDWLRDSVLGCPCPSLVHILLGIQEIEEGNFVRGQERWRMAGQQFDLSPLIIMNLIAASFQGEVELFESTDDLLTVAIEMYPDQPLMYFTRARLQRKNKQYDEAVKTLNYVIEKNPKIIAAYIELLRCYRENGNEAESAKVQNRILAITAEANPQERMKIEQMLKDVLEGK